MGYKRMNACPAREFCDTDFPCYKIARFGRFKNCFQFWDYVADGKTSLSEYSERYLERKLGNGEVSNA